MDAGYGSQQQRHAAVDLKKTINVSYKPNAISILQMVDKTKGVFETITIVK